MIVIASTNGQVGIKEAVRTLNAGGSALDAVEAGIRLVESEPKDHSVGYSGYPNLLGEVELDASIMDGDTLLAGSVGALKRYEHAISVARKVMEELPHVMLVGEGAARFASEMGFTEKDLLTEEAVTVWKQIFREKMPDIYAEEVKYLERIKDFARLAADPERPNETVNFIAKDKDGDIACGVSTSGWSWKYPGRLGDSAVIGAGNYADNRYGAAACTGRGEMAIRMCTAHSVVNYMKCGMSLHEAGARAITDLNRLVDPYSGRVSVIAMDNSGEHAGFSNSADATYIYMTHDMSEWVEAPRISV